MLSPLLSYGDKKEHSKITHTCTPSRGPETQAPPAAPATTNGITRDSQTAAPHPWRRAADRTETSHIVRGAVRLAYTHPKEVVAQRRPVRRPITAAIATPHRWHVACSGRSWTWSRCSRSRVVPTSHSRLTPVPAPALRSTSAAGAHAAQRARCGRKRAQPARLVVPIRMRHKLVPQPRAQVRPHLPREARASAHKRAPALRGARAWARCWRQSA